MGNRWSRGRPLTGGEVEELLLETLDLLEAAHEALADAALASRKTEAAYRIAFAREYLNAKDKTDFARQQHALRICEHQLVKRKEAEAVEVAAAELCRVRRTDVEALRSLIASARAAEYGRG